MQKVLTETEIDPVAEAVDLVMTQAEELAAEQRFATTEHIGDLSDGGMVHGAKLTPMQGGRKVAAGRAVARRAWMWNGTESLLPLAWNPEGTRHDNARRYLLKRHCLCCGKGGFYGIQCPACVKNSCYRCGGSRDRKQIIANFYLREEDVPFPTRSYGNIPCFLPLCTRQGAFGFQTETDMRLHASMRHRREYQAHTDAQQAQKADAVAELQKRVDTLMLEQIHAQPLQPVMAETVAPVVEASPPRAISKAKRKRAKRRITKPAMA